MMYVIKLGEKLYSTCKNNYVARTSYDTPRTRLLENAYLTNDFNYLNIMLDFIRENKFKDAKIVKVKIEEGAE